MAKKKALIPQKFKNVGKCCHHWLIGTPSGAFSKGICKFCGEEKEFANSFESAMYMKTERKPINTDISEDNIEV